MIKKKFALCLLSCLLVAGAFAGCQRAGDDVSETISRVGTDIASAVSSMESAAGSMLDGDRDDGESSFVRDESSAVSGESRPESSSPVSGESSLAG